MTKTLLWGTMIVLLLVPFLSLSEAIASKPVEGDTTLVPIPICAIKIANVKLNERLILLDITAEQDSIINDYAKYANQQDSIIIDMQHRIVNANDINNKLKKDIDAKTRRNKKLTKVSIASIAVAILTILIK